MAAKRFRLRLAGYAPPASSHGRALDLIAGELRATLRDEAAVEIEYNVLERGHLVQKLLADVENGETTLCYFSTSYLVGRVPALGIIDLPYVFPSLDHAHRTLDGPLGDALSELTRRTTRLVPLGYWDNGFRHLSNRSRDVRTPADCCGLKIRLQPNWIHEQFFRALGTEPVCNDLSEGTRMLKAGQLDAQENPLANIVAYGLDDIHRHITLTGHAYGARGVYASAELLQSWPAERRELLGRSVRAAIELQRELAARTELDLQQKLAGEGTTILELDKNEHDAFRAVATPLLTKARSMYDEALWNLLLA